MRQNKLLSGLITAVIKNKSSEVSKLLNAGVDPNDSEDTVNLTPLHFAAQYGAREAALVLIGAGANIDLMNEDGEKPEDIALKYGQKNMIELFNDLNNETTKKQSRMFKKNDMAPLI